MRRSKTVTKVNSSCFNGGALPRSTDAAAGFPGPGEELLLPSVGAAARGARAGVVPGVWCLSGHPEGGHEPRVSTARGNRCAVLGGFFVLGAPGDPRTANILYTDKQNVSKVQLSASHRLI